MSSDTGRAVPSERAGRPFTVAAFILAALSLAMFPIAGIAGIVCGALGVSRGDRRLGIASIVASMVGFIGGFVVAGVVLSKVVS